MVEIKAQTRMNSQVLQTVSSQLQTLNQHIQEMRSGSQTNNGSKTVSKLPCDVSLPLKTIQQVEKLEVKLRTSQRDRQNLVSYTNCYICFYPSCSLSIKLKD
jgi:hypothetical protein